MKKKKLFWGLKIVLTLFMAISIFGSKGVYADEQITITKQPESVEVSYPDGASFTVEVNDESLVESYQWYVSDGGSVFELKGTSATTKTLIVPSTMQDDVPMFYECAITDKSGNTVYTDTAVLTVNNSEEDKSVLYVGDHAIEPGEKIDLKDTIMGTGVISYESDGVTINFSDVNLDTTQMVYDVQIAPSLGLFFVRRNPTEQEYYFNFNGDCTITNTFFSERYNSGGVTFNSFFAEGDNPNCPTIVLGGEGSLTVWGGSNQIYSDVNVEIATDLYTVANHDIFTDGVRGYNVTIDEGVNVELNVNGTAIHTEADLHLLKDSKLKITSGAPHVSVGPTTKSLIFVGGSMYGENTDIEMYGFAKPENFVPYQAFVANMPGILLAGEGRLNLNQSNIFIELEALESDTDFAANFGGIEAAGETNAIGLDNSIISIKIVSPYVFNATGLYIPGKLTLNNSALNVEINTKGEVLGIESDTLIEVNDSNITVQADSIDGGNVFGIVCSNAEIELNDKKRSVYSNTPNGVAFAADTGVHGDEEYKPEENYQAQSITITGKAQVLKPEKATINIAAMPGYGEFIKAETFYNGDAIANEVLIGVPEFKLPTIAIVGIAVAALLLIGVACMYLLKKKNAKTEIQ